MKRTSKRLLALLLVLTMAIGIMPFAALSVGAEETIANKIVVGEDGTIQNLVWQPGYMLSATAPEGDEPWTAVIDGSWEQAYYCTGIMKVPAAGTTFVWLEPAVLDENGDPMVMGSDYCFLTSWVETAEDVWEMNLVGANLKSGYTNNSVAQPAVNYSYDAEAQMVIYTYTTTQDNEALRFGCYGGQADGTLASNPGECPEIYVSAPAFEEGNVENVLWLNGYVGSYLDESFAGKICNGGDGYVYSTPIMVPNAGTTISFSGATSDSAVYVFSAWRVAVDGRLEMIYGCPGGDESSAWLTVDEESGVQTYAYTTSYDNEIVRLSYSMSNEAAPVIHYVENNAEVLAPVLKAAGYDPTIGGTPYILPWYNGAINAEGGKIVTGTPSSRFSDVLAVYGKGTKVTFVDLTDADNGADGFADENTLVFGKFDGTNYDGKVNAHSIQDPLIDGGVKGATQAERDAAVEAGKMVYTYTTTEAKEYLRMTVGSYGNMINGQFVPPVVYVGETNTADSYNILKGKTIVALGDDYLRGGVIGDDNTWLSLLAGRYDMSLYNYSINGSTMTANTDLPSMAERYDSMVDGADIVILEGGKNDYLNNILKGTAGSNDPTVYYGAVKTVVDGLMAKYPDALIVCVTPFEKDVYTDALATYADSLNDSRVCTIRSADMPVFLDDNTYKALYMQEFNGLKMLNAEGNHLLMPLFEAAIGDAYLNYIGISTEGNGIQFIVGDELVDARGTMNQNITMIAPEATDAVCAENMFGWYGVVTNGDTTEVMLIKVGEAVEFNQGDVAVFEPLTLDMKQVSDPSLRIKNGQIAGLRFTAGVSKAEYKDLLTAIAGAEISFGMSIATPNGVKDVPFVMALNAAGDPVWYQEDEGYGYISATVWDSDINVHSAGIMANGYAKLTLDSEDYYAYAKNNNKKATSIYELAIEALNKVSTVQDADHKLQITKDLYSAYSVSERKALRSFVDDVVSMQTSEDGSLVELIEYEYYNPNSKWEITVFTEDDSIWTTLMMQLGNPDVSAISMLAAKDESASAAGGILLDGVVFEGVAIEYAGSTYYLIGFAEYSPNY